MGELYEFKIRQDGCIFDSKGQEFPHLDTHAFVAIDQPDGAVALISKIKRQILTEASQR